MRKLSMKRRGRQTKADSSPDGKDDFEEVSNGDINNDKNISDRKRKSRSRHSEENGRDGDSSDDKHVSNSDENGEKSGNDSSDEPDAKKKKSNKKGEDSDEEHETKKKRASKKAAQKKPIKEADTDDDEGDDEDEPERRKSTKKGDDSEDDHKTKKKRASKQAESKKPAKESSEDENDEEDEEDYEVEAIVNDKKVGNSRHYLIRWKGYTSESDTWEPEKTLNCVELLQKYKEAKTKKVKVEEEEVDENKDYEVDRILEVHFKRDGKREFLVVWKGYSSNDSTWEPEENMACPELIAKFMSKVEKAKTVDQRALRAVRAPTERFTLTTKDSGRRISKRNSNKQRVRYVDCE